MSKLRLDGIEVAIGKELSGYQKSVTEIVKEACKETADACLEDIKSASPKDTGAYRRGWKLKEEVNNALRVSYVIKNTTKPHLTHILEKGHAKVNGGRMEGIPHIKPAEDRAARMLTELVEEALKNGS